MGEIAVPYIIEDFDIGDRVYRIYPDKGKVDFGTVFDIINHEVLVKLDKGVFFQVPMDFFEQREDRSSYWGKPLPLSQLEPGSIISATLGGFKIYAEVNFVSDDIIRMTAMQGHRIINTYVPMPTASLEQQLLFWTLEE